MKHFKTRGFISIEVVITASFILAVGFFALLNFSTSGTNLMESVNGKLAGLGIFGGGSDTPGETIVYDENGYPEHLNISLLDVTPEENFVFLWDDTNNGWGIEEYIDDGRASIVVPSRLSDGLPVVSTLDYSYGWDQEHITSIVIPNTIKSIGQYSFSNGYLSSFIIPESVTNIGDGAFSWNELSSIVIPDSVVTIGDGAFERNNLTSIRIPSNATSIGESVFSDNQLTSVAIPNSVTFIGDNAFSYNQLTSVTIPSGVTSIGYGAFSDNQLTSVTIPNSVTSIGSYAFSYNQLTSVTFQNSLTSIGGRAFNNNLFPNSQAFFYSTPTDTSTLVSYGGTSKTIVIPEGTQTIGSSVFLQNEITSVTIPDSVTTIESGAFSDNQLTSLIIPDSVTAIGYTAFSYNQLSSVTIPDSVTSISSMAFANNQLTSLTIGNGVTTIGGGAFMDNQLTDVTFLGDIPFFDTSGHGGYSIFRNVTGVNTTIPISGIKVPLAHLASYRDSASSLGVSTNRIVGQ